MGTGALQVSIEPVKVRLVLLGLNSGTQREFEGKYSVDFLHSSLEATTFLGTFSSLHWNLFGREFVFVGEIPPNTFLP